MKILITESQNFSSEALQILEKSHQVVVSNMNAREDLLTSIPSFDAIFVRLRFQIDREILEAGKNLKFILSATTGLDHIDTSFFENSGGKIISLLGETEFLESIPSTAEHTWALLLALIKKVNPAFDHVLEGHWDRNVFINTNLKGKKIGILGLGRVGKQVAKYAEAFDMEVGYFDILKKDSTFQSFESAEDLFKWAEIISIHIPLNSKTTNFVDEKLLKNCKENSIIINTSRGRVWDEITLAKLIEEGKLAGVATDVLTDETINGNIAMNPLVLMAQKCDRILITPHIAGATKESMFQTETFIANKFLLQLNRYGNSNPNN